MLLAVDTSTSWIGLALFDDEQIVSEMTWQTKSHHSIELSPAIDQMMKRSAVDTGKLRALAVATGPGSFTSLRIGMAVVKGLSLALQIPVIGIPSLDILAAGVPVQNNNLAAVLQAGRGRLAVDWYHADGDDWVCEHKLEVLTPEELEQKIHKPTIICGELNTEVRQTLARRWKNVILASPAISVRRPACLAQLAWKRWMVMDVDDVISLAPVYLHYKEAIPG